MQIIAVLSFVAVATANSASYPEANAAIYDQVVPATPVAPYVAAPATTPCVTPVTPIAPIAPIVAPAAPIVAPSTPKAKVHTCAGWNRKYNHADCDNVSSPEVHSRLGQGLQVRKVL